jgi:hypothetical protein
MSGPDQRIHARIHVSTEVDVSTPNGVHKAELKDVSKGGARFDIPTEAGQVAAVGDTVELFLPALDGGEIVVMGQVVRIVAGPQALSYALRFDVVEPAMRQQLLDLIEVLLSSTSRGADDAAPRVARRIEIRFGQLAELRAILEDIAAGQLMMTVSEPLVLYEEVTVAVPDLGGGELLTLHARVVSQRAQTRAPLSGARQTWRVGLEFARMRPETARCLDAIIATVLEELGEVPPADTPAELPGDGAPTEAAGGEEGGSTGS